MEPGVGDEMPEVLAKQLQQDQKIPVYSRVEVDEIVREWKEQVQDQTDLLNKSEAKRRVLEASLKAQHLKYVAERTVLLQRIVDLEARSALSAAKQGMVPGEVHQELKTKADRLEKKLAATQKYAEQQRRAAIPARVIFEADTPFPLAEGDLPLKPVVHATAEGVES